MSFLQYDRMVKKFWTFNIPTVYPSVTEMENFRDSDEWVAYACYLYTCGKKPRNKDEAYRRRTLYLFITEHLELVDTPPEDYLELLGRANSRIKLSAWKAGDVEFNGRREHFDYISPKYTRKADGSVYRIGVSGEGVFHVHYGRKGKDAPVTGIEDISDQLIEKVG